MLNISGFSMVFEHMMGYKFQNIIAEYFSHAGKWCPELPDLHHFLSWLVKNTIPFLFAITLWLFNIGMENGP